MYLLIILFPLLGSIFAGLAGKYIGRKGSSFSSIFYLCLTWILSIFIFYEIILCHSTTYINLYCWCLFETFKISIGLLIDPLSSIMIVVISTISFLVHIYSIGYMSHDPYLSRFLSYLSLFTFFMLVLVTSNNFLQMFIGWEGVGLCSYLLINFWFTRIMANKAALKAMIMNRIADVFFTLALLLILIIFKSLDYIIVFTLLPFILNDNIIFLGIVFAKIDIIAIFLLIGALGKSAQIGLHTWLPDAMEGPTPVSALLHAATMVTAGVFLIIRCSFIIENSDITLFLLIFFGGITALFAGLVALFQYDIKKIIAYSTCSQLGYMFFSCGLSNYNAAIFHLFNHAFFKALLFLSAGSVIHALFDEQDMRKMGQLIRVLPFTYGCFVTASLAIMGFPFLTGFYSKDLILELVYSKYIMDANFIYFLALVAAILTASYSIRLIFFIFSRGKKTNIYKTYIIYFQSNIVECSWHMLIPMSLLYICSVSIGFLTSDLFIGWGTDSWNNSIYILPEHFTTISAEFLHPFIKNLPILMSLLFMYLTWKVMFWTSFFSKIGLFTKPIYLKIYFGWYYLASFFYHAGFFNYIYNCLFINLYFIFYSKFNKLFDKGLFEYIGPLGLYKLCYFLHFVFRYAWSLSIFTIIFFMFLAVCLFIFIFLFLINPITLVFINDLGLLFIIIFLILLGNSRYDNLE